MTMATEYSRNRPKPQPLEKRSPNDRRLINEYHQIRHTIRERLARGEPTGDLHRRLEAIVDELHPTADNVPRCNNDGQLLTPVGDGSVRWCRVCGTIAVDGKQQLPKNEAARRESGN